MTPATTRSLGGVVAVALLALPAAAAQAAPVTLFVAKGPAVTALPGPGPEDVYDVGEELEVGCGAGAVPLAAGWTGAGGPVDRVRPRLGDADEAFTVETRRPQTRTRPRALAICARGTVKATLAEKGGQQVSCGSKLAIGVAASTTWPYFEQPVSAQPLGTHGWQMQANDQTRASAICVSPSAFSKVATVSASRSFRPGASSATVAASCSGGRRPIGWGYEAPVMASNGWASADSPSKLTVPFVASSQPAGRSGWSVTFRTPDQRGAKAPAKVTAHVICAIPAGGSATARAAARVRPPKAQVEDCRRAEGRAKTACRARNAANKKILEKLLDTRLVGVRGDGQQEDWSFCRDGRYFLASTSGGSTGTSRGSGWQVESAKIRQGGKWFDAIVTSRDGTSIAVAMRGGRWQVGIEFGDEPDELGPAVRSSAREVCAR